jgi:hypothetical protein
MLWRMVYWFRPNFVFPLSTARENILSLESGGDYQRLMFGGLFATADRDDDSD